MPAAERPDLPDDEVERRHSGRAPASASSPATRAARRSVTRRCSQRTVGVPPRGSSGGGAGIGTALRAGSTDGSGLTDVTGGSGAADGSAGGGAGEGRVWPGRRPSFSMR